MTLETNYLEMIKKSAEANRIVIPEFIHIGVCSKLERLTLRNKADFPKNVIYSECFTERKVHSSIHLGSVRQSGWQVDILKVVTKKDEDPIITLCITKKGASRNKHAVVDHKNGNNSGRIKVSK